MSKTLIFCQVCLNSAKFRPWLNVYPAKYFVWMTDPPNLTPFCEVCATALMNKETKFPVSEPHISEYITQQVLGE